MIVNDKSTSVGKRKYVKNNLSVEKSLVTKRAVDFKVNKTVKGGKILPKAIGNIER